MKKIFVIKLSIFALSSLLSFSSSAQCDCSQTRLSNILNNITVQVLDLSNNPVSSLSPGTDYRIRVTATAYYCTQSGSGCSAIGAPTMFLLKQAVGVVQTSTGNPIPPVYGLHTGPFQSWTVNFAVTTLTGSDFSTSIFLLIGATCFPSVSCDDLESGLGADRFVLLNF